MVVAGAPMVAAQSARAADDVFISVDEAHKLVGNPNVRFIFADGEKDFEKAHISGAVDAFAHDLHYLNDIRASDGLPMTQAHAFQYIGRNMGVDARTQVIVYDGGMGANASGDWFFLRLYGQSNVNIMDGGLATWQAKGYAVEKGATRSPAAKHYSGSVRRDMIASKEEVLKATKDSGHYLILDARHNLDEYTGKSLLAALAAPGKEETVARGGYIPTAVFSPWTKYAGNKGGDANKPTLKSAKDLSKQLDKLKRNGYAPNKTVISYCHVGLGRGSFQYLALRKAGHANTKVYIGSWDEWGNTPSLPVGKAQ
jgi:thiosulfate/3-mercaptopyruvate sulfurtransferase